MRAFIANSLRLAASIAGNLLMYTGFFIASIHGLLWSLSKYDTHLRHAEAITRAREETEKAAYGTCSPNKESIKLLGYDKDKESTAALEELLGCKLPPIERLWVSAALLEITPARQNAGDIVSAIQQDYPLFKEDSDKAVAIKNIAVFSSTAHSFLKDAAANDPSLEIRLLAIQLLLEKQENWSVRETNEQAVQEKHFIADNLLFVADKMGEFPRPVEFEDNGFFHAGLNFYKRIDRFEKMIPLARQLKGCATTPINQQQLQRETATKRDKVMTLLTKGNCR